MLCVLLNKQLHIIVSYQGYGAQRRQVYTQMEAVGADGPESRARLMVERLAGICLVSIHVRPENASSR